MPVRNAAPRWIEFVIGIDLGSDATWSAAHKVAARLGTARIDAVNSVKSHYPDSVVEAKPAVLKFDDLTISSLKHMEPES